MLLIDVLNFKHRTKKIIITNLLIMLLIWPESYLLLYQFISYANVRIVLIWDFF